MNSETNEVCPCCGQTLPSPIQHYLGKEQVTPQQLRILNLIVAAGQHGIETEALLERLYGGKEIDTEMPRVQIHHLNAKLKLNGYKIRSFGWGRGGRGRYRLVLLARRKLMRWNEYQLEELKRSWGKTSSSVIAGRLGITKSAVIGKAHRLGLKNLKRDPYQYREEGDRVKKVKEVMRNGPSAPAVVAPPCPDDAAMDEVVAGGIDVMSLGHGQCKWPVNDGSPRFFFCGEPVIEAGVPYCREHADAAYDRAALARYMARVAAKGRAGLRGKIR